MKIEFLLTLFKKAIFTLIFSLAVFRCADDELLIDAQNEITSDALNTVTSGAKEATDCISCTYIVPEDASVIDGEVLRLKPGSIIGLNANFAYKALRFRNIVGTPDNPIIIRNCGGTVNIDGTGAHDGIRMETSKHFRITGGDVDGSYGIIVNAGHMGVNLGNLSTDFEVDHLKIMNSGFAGIMAKTDPGCDEATWRGNFLMKNVALHNNYITDTGGEGIYAGNSFFTGMNTSCGVKLPHEIHNIKIYGNILKNTGWEGIQLGCATKGASIHGNTVENYGLANVDVQNNGIQIGTGTGGLCYNNLIRKGTGNGLIVLGLGDNIIYNNIIEQAGIYGIFCDERYTPGPGFKFLNNTIINSQSDGIRIYAEKVSMNVIMNNIIANPGSYSTYRYPRSAEDAFVYRLSDDVKIKMSNNYFTRNTDSLEIRNLSAANYILEGTSPVIDKGADISSFINIQQDFYDNVRMSGEGYDIGAVETVAASKPAQNKAPVAYAGRDRIVLGLGDVKLTGSGSDADGSVIGYKWTQYRGPLAVINDAHNATATVALNKEGTYFFRLTVTDNKGLTHFDNMLINVTNVSVPAVDEFSKTPSASGADRALPPVIRD